MNCVHERFATIEKLVPEEVDIQIQKHSQASTERQEPRGYPRVSRHFPASEPSIFSITSFRRILPIACLVRKATHARRMLDDSKSWHAKVVTPKSTPTPAKRVARCVAFVAR